MSTHQEQGAPGPHISLSIMFLIISGGTSPSVLIASLFGSGLKKYKVGRPRTWFEVQLLKIKYIIA